jgi:hypothetical protein
MNQQGTSSVLAAYATLKSLSDENKYHSPYQILREFIRYIIISDALYSFSAIEMKNQLANHFGFLIPEAVVKSSLGNMGGILLNHGTYTVCMEELGSDSVFEDKKKEADDYESSIIQLLSEYISNRTQTANIDESVLSQALARFLTDDTSIQSTKYTDLIGEFVLKNENNKEVQDGLNKIREGSILYLGLCHNIGEVGSITKPLTLYLGTEILFSFAGYNGEIYQQFANDFFDQVRTANSGKTKKITLYYFSDIKKEIEEYFNIAREIVEGKRHSLLDKPAMKAITDGCCTATDVDVKKADFYYLLKYSYGIMEDPNDNYYDEEYFSSNLESFEYEDEADKNKKKEMAIKLISHINKLRNGNHYHSDIESEHLIITNTKAILLISKEQVEILKTEKSLDHLCNFAVTLDRITSLLWYKLGNGFSKKAYPTSVKAVLKARVVLSASIAKKAERAFAEVKQQYENNTIEEQQVAARIITIKKKPTLPEDLEGDDIDEIMDFSPEYLNRYEEQFKNNQNALREKVQIIKSLEADTKKTISERDATIASQQGLIKKKDDENSQLRDQLREYQYKEEARVRKKELCKNVAKFAWSLIWKSAIIAIITVIVIVCEKKFNFTIPPLVYTVVDALGLILILWKDTKKVACKIFSKNRSTVKSR